jgi:hypothetical protein
MSVVEFLEHHSDNLTREIARYIESHVTDKAMDQTLLEISEDWKRVGADERAAPYRAGEKEFWFGYHLLGILLRRTLKTIDREGPKVAAPGKYVEVEKNLAEAYAALTGEKSLPKSSFGRRPT